MVANLTLGEGPPKHLFEESIEAVFMENQIAQNFDGLEFDLEGLNTQEVATKEKETPILASVIKGPFKNTERVNVQNQNDLNLIEFRKKAISMQRAFSEMTPIVQRSHFLSTNAEVSSARLGARGDSFSIIARELVAIVKELEIQIFKLNEVFRGISQNVATWISNERHLELYHRALTCYNSYEHSEDMAEDTAESTVVNPVVNTQVNNTVNLSGNLSQVLSRKTGGQWENAQVRSKGDRFLFLLWQKLIDTRKNMMERIDLIKAETKTIAKAVDRISWVAVRQSHFTAIMARVEAAKMDEDGKAMVEVAKSIRQLADDIAGAEKKARNQVMDLVSLSNQLMSNINRASRTA